MSQPAQTLAQAQNLRIGYNEIENPSDQSGARNNSFEPIKSELFDEVVPFYYNGRIRISFSTADTYKRNFILIKGLIEFHRPKWLGFNYDKKQHGIETDIPAAQLDELATFVTMVTMWLKKEIQFQYALKRAIVFEKRYKLEGNGIYSVLNGVNAGTR